MLGQKICKLERFFFGKWIRCSECLTYEEQKCYDEILGETSIGHVCTRFHGKPRHTLNWQYCYYFERKEPLKYVEILKHVIKSIGKGLIIILTIPIRPILKLKADNEYLKERNYELRRELYEDDLDD